MTANWSFTGDMADSLSKLTLNLKEWNKQVYGQITTKKRHIVRKIANIQNRMDLSSSNRLAQVDLILRQELENVLHHEELLWKQKARCDWLYLGDCNTKFFHSRTLQRKKTIEAEANMFFQKLYGECLSSIVDLPPRKFP
ncbi:Endonuclease/exonuclease/phosphatase [Gossypium australe]|uniref:Endonuclease/exonuclease/phosphatase n=1 Tax=Gossypium australe TaxID=47621 RepID=A0A5B6VL71_9ROSI|nr:Endonuclease/exonuclease/phosphatase [Gossypium australe]